MNAYFYEFQSEIEEKAIVDKVRHTQSYKVAVINLIGRIRNAKSTGLGKAKAGKVYL